MSRYTMGTAQSKKLIHTERGCVCVCECVSVVGIMQAPFPRVPRHGFLRGLRIWVAGPDSLIVYNIPSEGLPFSLSAALCGFGLTLISPVCTHYSAKFFVALLPRYSIIKCVIYHVNWRVLKIIAKLKNLK